MNQRKATMKISILFYGLLLGYFLAFVISVFESYTKTSMDAIDWPYLILGVLITLTKFSSAKVREDKLPDLKGIMLIGNITAILFGAVMLMPTSRTLAGVALAVPNLITIIYLSVLKIKKQD